MTSKINLKTLFTMPMAPPPNKLSLHAKQFDGETKERQCCARFYGGYCSLWPNRTARFLSMAWPSLLRAHNHIGGATAVPLHHKKCLLCSVLIYIVLAPSAICWHKIKVNTEIISMCDFYDIYRKIILMIIIISLGRILLSYIANTSRTYARMHAHARTHPLTPHPLPSLCQCAQP